MSSPVKTFNLKGGTAKKDINVNFLPKFEEIKIDKTPFVQFERNKHLTIGEGDEQEEYYKTEKSKRTSVSFGQLKLLMCELEFLTIYWKPNKVPNPIVVYAGASSGVHINILTKLFPQFK